MAVVDSRLLVIVGIIILVIILVVWHVHCREMKSSESPSSGSGFEVGRGRNSWRHGSSSSSSSSSSSDSADSLGGGLRDRCRKSSDCASGLTCESRVCVCPKVPPPQVWVQANQNSTATVTWSPVPGADYYNVYVFNQNMIGYGVYLFQTGTVLTTGSLPLGTYTAYAMSGSHDCGTSEQTNTSNSVNIYPL